MKMTRRVLAAMTTALLFLAGTANASGYYYSQPTYEVTIINATPGQVFSPPVLVTHSRDISLFEVGTPALPELGIVAEDGAGQPLVDLLSTIYAVSGAQTTPAPIPPGGSAVYEIRAPRNDVLSIVSMLVNTNDAFLALDSRRLPRRRGATRTYSVLAYDAGTEANNEDCAFIPGPACPAGSGNARAVDGAEGFVHVHNGVHGVADLGPVAYDWRNPVAIIKIKRTR